MQGLYYGGINNKRDMWGLGILPPTMENQVESQVENGIGVHADDYLRAQNAYSIRSRL